MCPNTGTWPNHALIHKWKPHPLGASHTWFERTERMEDLEEAIQTARRAVEVTPPNHPNMVGRLNNLGNKLLLSQPLDNEEALQRFL